MRARRGLTLIETVLAVTLLAMVAAGVFSAISSMVAAQDRQQERLAAAELANRFMLQYLDDKDSMPDQMIPVAYAERRYRWSYTEEPVQIKLPDVRAPADTSQRGTPQQRTDLMTRFKLVKVRVWLGEESGGSASPGGFTPEFSLTRLVNSANLARNPDSFQNQISTDAGMRRLMDEFLGTAGGGGGGGPAAGRPGAGGRPATPNRTGTTPRPAPTKPAGGR